MYVYSIYYSVYSLVQKSNISIYLHDVSDHMNRIFSVRIISKMHKYKNRDLEIVSGGSKVVPGSPKTGPGGLKNGPWGSTI